MKKYVINLKRRPDRLEQFKNNFGSHFSNDIEVVYGFDGKNFNNELKEEQELIKKCFNIKLGEVGCALSHFRIYKDIINNYDYGMIFEDDAIPCENFTEKLNIILDQVPKDFDFLYIGGRFHKDFTMPDNYVYKISSNIVQHNEEHFGPAHDRTTHSYIISKKMAQKLLDIFNNDNLKRPLDHWILEMLRKENIKIYNSNPLLCYSPMNSNSDIR
jgi:GR25 family glycosyltransferase involved in LPS biosynthesis